MSKGVRALASAAGVMAFAVMPAAAQAICPTCPVPVVPPTTVTDPTGTVQLQYGGLYYIPAGNMAYESAGVAVNPYNQPEPAGAQALVATNVEAGGFAPNVTAGFGEVTILDTTPTGTVIPPPVVVSVPSPGAQSVGPEHSGQ